MAFSLGKYCPSASPVPTSCSAGRVCSKSGLSEPDEDCHAGMYYIFDTSKFSNKIQMICHLKGSSEMASKLFFSLLLFLGYWCDSGASIPNDPNKKCPVGKYCLAATTEPNDCPEGTYRYTFLPYSKYWGLRPRA